MPPPPEPQGDVHPMENIFGPMNMKEVTPEMIVKRKRAECTRNVMNIIMFGFAYIREPSARVEFQMIVRESLNFKHTVNLDTKALQNHSAEYEVIRLELNTLTEEELTAFHETLRGCIFV